MNELQAREIVLVRAIEMADTKHAVLSEDDRNYASRSARELAQWHAAERKADVTTEMFLQQRAEQIIKRLGERTPSFAAFTRRGSLIHLLGWALPLLALVAGAVLDRIGDPHRVDLLSAPLLGIVGWNLLVYVLLLASLPFACRLKAPSALVRRLAVGAATLPRKLPGPLASGLSSFMVEWSVLSAPLLRARLARTLHLAAAMFGLGAVLSLYARGLLSQYVAGWESTFLDAGQVHAILSAVFAPAVAIFPLEPFSSADIAALRFGATRAGTTGAHWVNLWAATLVLLVVVPRLVLAVIAAVRARWLAQRFPLNLEQPYFRKLAGQAGSSAPALLRVLPYSFTLDEGRDRGLAAIAVTLLGEQARVMLRPSSAYGEEALAQLREVQLDDPAVTITAVLFNLAATPEKENHGAFLDHLVRATPSGIAVLVDESALTERGGGSARLAERIALWQQFCGYHGTSATIVNLLQPDLRPLDAGAGLTVSKAP